MTERHHRLTEEEGGGAALLLFTSTSSCSCHLTILQLMSPVKIESCLCVCARNMFVHLSFHGSLSAPLSLFTS